MSDYDFVARSSLKLKRSNEPGLSKKSKKHKKKAKQELSDERQRELVEQALDTATTATSNTTGQNRLKTSGEAGDNSWMTEAQKKFLAQQEKRQLARVMEKATKSHKQRVEEFNTHLENLSEHYDIPKVSWTK